VPRLIKLSGVLDDPTGKPLSGPVDINFAIYKSESDAEPLWQETQILSLDEQGRYTVLLGAMQPEGLPVELFASAEARWLGVSAGELPEQPRILLASVPYALKAGDAETLGGKPASAYLLAQPTENSAPAKSGTGGGTRAGAAGAPSRWRPVAGVPTPLAVGGASSGATNFLAKWVDSSNDLGNSLMFDNGTNVGIGTATPGTLNGTYFPSLLLQASQAGASTYLTADTALAGGYAGVLLNRGAASANNRLWAIENRPATSNTSSQFAISTYTDAGTPTALLTLSRAGNLGIGTTTPGTLNGSYFPSLLLQASQAGASTYLTADTALAGGYAGVLLNRGVASPNNRLWAIENQPAAGNASSQFAISTYSDAGMPAALLTILRSGNVGIGTTTPAFPLDVAGNINSSGTINAVSFTGSGAGLTGVNAATAVTATNALELGGSLPSAYATTGANTFNGSQSVVASASGVTALSVQATDVTSANTGVSGLADGAAGTGVVGEAENGSLAIGLWGISSSGYAGQFTGNLNVTGAITAGTKDFKIDDPIDPANKYLYHASVESAEMMNVYSGNVTLDDKGEGDVVLPHWFEALNRDFRYQLTCIGGFSPVYIAEEIKQSRFKIAGGKPGMKVSWQVSGIRQDAFARAHPLQVEVAKPERERGFYIHPELYGAGEEKDVEWANHPQQMRRISESQAKAAGWQRPEER
jgi:hypothetical protein